MKTTWVMAILLAAGFGASQSLPAQEATVEELEIVRAVGKATMEDVEFGMTEEEKAELARQEKERMKEEGMMDEDPVEETVPGDIVARLKAAIDSGTPLHYAMAVEASKATTSSGQADWFELPEDGVFDENYLLRLRVYLYEPGYVYFLTTDSDGAAALFYPKAEGEPFSAGTHELRPQGMINFPKDFYGMDGLTYDAAEFMGTESFLVIGSKTKIEGLPALLGEFCQIARAEAEKEIAPQMRSVSSGMKPKAGGLGFTDIKQVPTKLPSGMGNVQADATPAPTPTPAATPSGSQRATVFIRNVTKLASRSGG